MRISKGLRQRRHAMQRAYERYGIVLDGETESRIVDAIQGCRSRVIERRSHRVAVHELVFDGQVIRVVWDRKRQELVTFLP